MSSRRPDPGQASFDLDQLLRLAEIEAAPGWVGAPLGFTTEYWPAAALDAAFRQWQFLHGQFGSVPRSHMWHRGIGAGRPTELGAHTAAVFSADLRCQPDQHPPGDCACTGGLIQKIVCDPCGWQTISAHENTAVEAWHDHALPDWRSLPVMPARLRTTDRAGLGQGRAGKWIEEHYPAAAQVPGAPIITERIGPGTRHVPGGSPWGGWDIAATDNRNRSVARPAAALTRSLELRPFGARRPPTDSASRFLLR